MAEIRLSYLTGVMQPTFSQQIRKQKLLYKKDEVAFLNKQKEAVYLLKFKGLISEKAATAALKKILKRLVSHVVKENKLKRIKTPQK